MTLSRLTSLTPLSFRPSQITEPPDEVIDIAIDAYSKKVYFQPLPLFNLQGLRENFDSFPQFLQWGFLALCLRYFNHPFYRGKEASAIDFYTTASRKIAMAVAFEGAAKLEIQQALCLLALCDTMGKSQWLSRPQYLLIKSQLGNMLGHGCVSEQPLAWKPCASQPTRTCPTITLTQTRIRGVIGASQCWRRCVLRSPPY